MPRSAGVYTLPIPPFVAGAKILANDVNTDLADIALALTGSLPRDGTAGMAGALPMGSNRITGLADATATTDAAAFGQLPEVLVLREVVSVAVGTHDITLPSGFIMFRLIGLGITPTSNATMFARISRNNGVSYDAGASDYNTAFTFASSSAVAAGGGSAANFSLSTTALGNDARVGFSLEIDPGAASRACNMRIDSGYVDTSSVITRFAGFGTRNATGLATNLRVGVSTGNFTGTFILLGRR